MTGERWVWQSFGALEHSLRTGTPAFDQVFGAPLFDYYAAHPDAARVSAEGLKSVGRGQDAASPQPMILPGPARWWTSVAARAGCWPPSSPQIHWPVACCSTFPTWQPWPGNPSKPPGCRTRCRIEAGDFFREVPARGDIYLLRKVIHDWDDERARHILRTCRSAMTEGSRLLLLEMMVPAGNAPAYAKLLDLLMLVYAGGRERTETEYRDLLMSARFSVSRIVPTASAVSIIEATPV